jgi:L-threonylcarbamoyladenylate synthase
MVDCRPATPLHITAAAAAIRCGRLLAFGTETVYGLGGDATNSMAVAKIYGAKERPSFNPLISHVDTADRAFRLGVPNSIAKQLADAFWPGPMTLILMRKTSDDAEAMVCDLATAGLDSIALRVPAKAASLDFLAQCGCPVAAPSANKSGRISPTRASHVLDELGDVAELDFILDTGVAENGVESTIIDARSDTPIILRPGSITAAMVEAATGHHPRQSAHNNIISPGQLDRHYAPSKPIILNTIDGGVDGVQIGFGVHDGDFNLSPSGDLIEAAANLYHFMRRADMTEAGLIAIAPIPEESLGIAINDRLRRAASSHQKTGRKS